MSGLSLLLFSILFLNVAVNPSPKSSSSIACTASASGLGTFHRFYKLNYIFILVFDFEKLSSSTSCIQANFRLSY